MNSSNRMQVLVKHMFLYLLGYLYLVVLFLDMEGQRFIHPPCSEFCIARPANGQD